MKIVLLLTGKTIGAHLQPLIQEYSDRLKHYGGFETIVVQELKNTRNISVTEQKEKEADLILKHLEINDDVVLLDENGQQFSSKGFAEFIARKQMASPKRLVFIVGGPFGFSQRIYDRTPGKISLSKMTFSHQMIRLLFVEQLYRAMTILKGEKYHHE